MAKRGRDARSWGTIRGSQIRQRSSSRRRVSVVRKAQKEFGEGKSAQAWTGIRLGEKIPLQTQRSPPLKLFPLLPEPEGPTATTRLSLRGRNVPTSDSAQQPELTSSLSARPCGIDLAASLSFETSSPLIPSHLGCPLVRIFISVIHPLPNSFLPW